MKTIAFYNLKGGVGKTASAVNIAYLAARQGKRTLLWDLDPQGAAAWYLLPEAGDSVKAKKVIKGRVPVGELVQDSPYERLDVIPADFSYRNLDVALDQVDGPHVLERLIQPFSEQYALLVLDCPPSLSKLAEAVFQAADRIFMPLIPTHLSLRSYDQARAFLKEHKLGHKQLHPFFSLVDRRRGLHRQWLEQPPESLKRLLGAAIPYSAAVERMGEKGAPLHSFNRTDPAALAYEQLWREIASILKL